jgi:hypothetical protein
MSKTPFSNKCQVLGELWLYYREDARHDEVWSQFFDWADVALPLSYMIWQDLAILDPDNSDEGAGFINAAWDTFCEMVLISPDEKYSTLRDCWDASPNSEIPRIIEMEM